MAPQQGGADFLEFIFNDARAAADRLAITMSLRVLLAPFAIDFALADCIEGGASSKAAQQPCSISHCPRVRAVRAGDFCGSERCADHHVDGVREALERPKLRLFLQVCVGAHCRSHKRIRIHLHILISFSREHLRIHAMYTTFA